MDWEELILCEAGDGRYEINEVRDVAPKYFWSC